MFRSTLRKSIRLGQNFLINPHIARKFISLLNLESGDLVVEVGAGKGMLTRALSVTGAKVEAVEIDHNLLKYLSLISKENPNVQIHITDFLAWSLPSQEFQVAANPPFNRVTEIVSILCKSPYFTSGVLMIPVHKFKEIQMITSRGGYHLKVEAKVGTHNFSPRPSETVLVVRVTKPKFAN